MKKIKNKKNETQTENFILQKSFFFLVVILFEKKKKIKNFFTSHYNFLFDHLIFNFILLQMEIQG